LTNYGALCYNVAMVNITKTIENHLTTYDPNEFLPIYRDGELENRVAFVAYKVVSDSRMLLAKARLVAGAVITAAVREP
jgi:hypothetical protein